MDNEFELPDYYNTSNAKVKEELVKRKCFTCGKEAKMGKFERYCNDTCRSRATKHYSGSYGAVR